MKLKIELFKIILERNNIVRPLFNSRQRLRYSKTNGYRDQVIIRTVEAKRLKDRLIAFTKKTFKRRRRLAKLLKTIQYKNCDNYIRFVKIDNHYYTPKNMQEIILDWEVENILLGEQDVC